MNNKEFDMLEEAVRALTEGSVPEGPSAELKARTLERIEQARQHTNTNPLWERIRTMKPLGKVAAAAIIVFAVGAMFLFNSTPSSVALADVYSRVQKAQAFLYKMTGTVVTTPMPGKTVKQEMDSTVLISTEHGMKLDNKIYMPEEDRTSEQQMIFIPHEKVALMIMPAEKKYIRMEFTDDLMNRTQQQNNDPRRVIKQMLDCEFTDLGRSELDGVTVQGFETSDPAYFGGVFSEDSVGKVTLWIDARTWMPVQMDMALDMGEQMQMQMTMYDFQWDVAVTAEDFAPAIGEGYEEAANFKMPEMNEASAIAGLQKYLDLTGEYPKSLDMMTVIQEVNKALATKPEFRERIKRMMESDDEKGMMDLAAQEMLPVQGLVMFYMTLVQERKDPAYHPGVTPGDADSVLMQWQIEGDRYRVIFGDLSTGELSREDLPVTEPEPAAEATP